MGDGTCLFISIYVKLGYFTITNLLLSVASPGNTQCLNFHSAQKMC